MSQEPRDITRSLHFHVMQFLKEYNNDYDIRIAIEEDAWERPAAIVQSAGPAILNNRGRRVAETIRPYSIYVYPQKGENPKLAELEALRVEGVIARIFQVGGNGGRPRRIPVFDWSEVLDTDGLPEGAEPVGFMRVTDASVDHKPDPDDENLQTVWATIRLNWRGVGEPKPGGPIIQSVSVESQNAS